MSNYVGTKGVKYYCASECTCELCARTGAGGDRENRGQKGYLSQDRKERDVVVKNKMSAIC